jgi:hypothetical protein
MAFNGSGTYNLPAGNPVVTGTTISSSTTNTTNSDIATALTNCITRDGQSTPSANLPMNAKKLTGLAAGTSAGDSVRYEQVVLTASLGTNVATFLATPSSANLAAALTDETGSGAAVFATSPTLVTPVLGTPSSGNLSSCTNAVGYGLKSATTTVSVSAATAPTAGQALVATSSTTATWQSPASGAMVLLSTVSASAASTVDLETTIDSTYDTYMVTASGITLSNGGNGIRLRYKVAGAYVTTSTYIFQRLRITSDTGTYLTTQAGTGAPDTSISIINNVGGSAGQCGSFTLYLYTPSSTSNNKQVIWQSAGIDSTGNTSLSPGAGQNTGTGAVTGVRFYASSGTVTGNFCLYGIAK